MEGCCMLVRIAEPPDEGRATKHHGEGSRPHNVVRAHATDSVLTGATLDGHLAQGLLSGTPVGGDGIVERGSR